MALRRAICLAIDIDQEIRLFWRGQAIPAQSSLMPNTIGYDPDVQERQRASTTSRRPRRCSTLYGYVDRDGDGWREQPDGSPLVLDWATTPDQRARQRDELRRKDMSALGIRVELQGRQVAREPEERARRQAAGVEPRHARRRRPTAVRRSTAAATSHKGGQNLARFSNRTSTSSTERITRDAGRSRTRAAVLRGQAHPDVAYAPYKFHVHRILTDLAWPWVLGFPPTAVLAGVVAVRRHRRRSAQAKARQ